MHLISLFIDLHLRLSGVLFRNRLNSFRPWIIRFIFVLSFGSCWQNSFSFLVDFLDSVFRQLLNSFFNHLISLGIATSIGQFYFEFDQQIYSRISNAVIGVFKDDLY